MVDKKMLVILVLLAFHVFYGRDLGEQSEILGQQAQLLQRKIVSEGELATRANMSEADLARLEAAAAYNSSYFFPSQQNISTAIANLQQRIKEAGKKSGVSFASLRAGEPQEEPGQPYVRLPLSFTVTGQPDQTGQFLLELSRMDRYLRIFSADIHTEKKEHETFFTWGAQGVGLASGFSCPFGLLPAKFLFATAHDCRRRQSGPAAAVRHTAPAGLPESEHPAL